MQSFRIRITKEYTTEGGLTVWPGDVFYGLLGDAEYATKNGTEVKVAGEYIEVPSSHFELVKQVYRSDRVHD